MYVTANQIQNGLIRYINQDMMPKLDGWKKILFGASLDLIREQDLTRQLLSNSYISMLGIMDENGMIDIDRLKTALENQIGNQKFDISFPIIGTFKIGQADVEHACQAIKQGDET